MKKNLLKKLWLRTLMLVAILLSGAGSAWGDEVTLSYSGSTTNMTGDNDAATLGLNAAEWSVVGSKGGHNLFPGLNKSGYIALYYNASGSNSMTVSTLTNATINSISITFTSSGYSNASVSVGGNIISSVDGTYAINGTSFVITNANTTSVQVRISKIIIDYTPAGALPSCAIPTFSPAAGTYSSAQSVTLSTSTAGATIYYTTDGAEPTTNSSVYNSAITVSQTTTIKAIAVAEGYDNSDVASATYTIVDPSTPGTDTTPYTVAQARAAIDAGTGINNVYATGIVSEIPTAYSADYKNITFNIIDEGGAGFLQAYRCGGDDAANVEVGDIVVVFGNLTKYNSTYEFAQGCQLISLTKATVAQPTFNPTAGAYTEQQSVTIACETEGATIYYTTDGTEPTAESTEYTAPITVSQTTTIKAIAIKGGALSTVVSAIYTIQEPNAPGTENNPYTVADAIEFINTLGGAISNYEIYVSGIVSTAPTQNPTSSGQLTYYISDDGTTSTEMEVYRGKGLNGADFSSKDDLKVGDEVTVKGYVKLYKETPEFDTGSILTSFNRPETPAETYAINWNNPEGVTVRVYNAEDASIEYNNGDKVAKNTTIRIDVERPDYITVESLLVQDGTQTIEMANYDSWVYTMLYDHDVTITVVVADSRTVTSMSYSSDGPQWNSVTQTVTISSAEEFVMPILVINNGAEIRDEVEYSSSNTDVATIDATGKVTIVGPGTVVITATFAGNNAYQPCDDSYTIVFNAPNFAELPFEFDGGRADVATTDGLTQEGLDSDYGSSPKLKFNGTGDFVLLAFNEQPGTLTFDIKGNTFSGGTFTVQTSEDGVTFTDLKSYTELGDTQSEEFDNLGENVRYIKWVYTEKSSGNVALGNIKLGSANPNEPVISASNITLASSATSGEIPYTITNPVAGQSLTATTAAEWISDIVVGEDAITFTTTENQGDEDRSAVFTLTYQGADTKTVTVTQSRFVIDFATLPFAWEGGASADLLALDGVTANGLGTDYADGHAPYLVKLDGTGDYIQVKTNERPGIVTIGVKMAGGGNTSTITVQESADGETFTDVQALTISGAQNDILNLSTTTEFAESSRYVRLLFTKGSNVGVGPITIAQYEDIVLEDYTLSIAESENVTITANYGEEVLTNGENADITQGTEITLAITPAEGYDLASLTITGAEEGQTVTPVASSTTAGVYTFTMPAFAVTVTATVVEHVEPVLATYVLATSVTSGKRYVIASGTTEGTIQVMGNQANNNRPAVGATIDADGKLSVSDEYEFVIESATIGAATGYSIFDEGDNGYLYAAGNGSNYLRTQADNDANGIWTITFGEEGVASIVAESSSNRNVMQYNGTNKLFSCYATASQSPVYLYEKVETPPASKGDVNNDGNVTIADVTALVNIILGKDTEGVYDHEAADVNGDEGITIADVTALVNIILGKNQN